MTNATKIIHVPNLNTKKVIDLYTKKDGVDIKYVCTTTLENYGEYSIDIFYRDTEHPEFGNKYFGLYINFNNQIMICNADSIDGLEIHCIKDNNDNYRYSSHRHDYIEIDGSMIDGGRDYTKTNGCVTYPFIIENGIMRLINP